jgi:hypothetical protein
MDGSQVLGIGLFIFVLYILGSLYYTKKPSSKSDDECDRIDDEIRYKERRGPKPPWLKSQ